MKVRSLVRASAPLVAMSMLLIACGDDDEAASTTTEAAEEGGGGNRELCALAEELFEQEDFPSAEQIEQYTELAPAELEEAVAVAGPPIIEADRDPTKFFAAIADDDVEAATLEIDEWETENCGIEHDPAPSEAQSTLDPSANRVDVTSTEYTFDFPKEIPAGRSSFVLKNPGQEVHFMVITQLADGHTLDEALAFEGDPAEAGLVTDLEFDSGLAATGGEDDEVITADLPAGNYGMLCFVPGPDGTPHAYTGMAVPFTVR